MIQSFVWKYATVVLMLTLIFASGCVYGKRRSLQALADCRADAKAAVQSAAERLAATGGREGLLPRCGSRQGCGRGSCTRRRAGTHTRRTVNEPHQATRARTRRTDAAGARRDGNRELARAQLSDGRRASRLPARSGRGIERRVLNAR